MVRIVLAGGTGNVGRELLDGLLARGTHDVAVFTRSGSKELEEQGVNVVIVDYGNKEALTKLLVGVDVVLSFVIAQSDPTGAIQKTLVDASVAAGVKRFAPSEWATKSNSGNKMYASKDILHEYLREINKDKQVLEYTLFQPGFFADYLTKPYPSSKHVHLIEFHWDLQNRRVIVPAEGDYTVTFTTVRDLVRVVIAAIEYQGPWPETGGISGHTLTNSELIQIAEGIRGPFKVEQVSKDDLDAGRLNTSWTPRVDHPSIPRDLITKEFSEHVIADAISAGLRGTWHVSDEWNKLLPDLKLMRLDEFLRAVWEGKP